MQWLQSDYKTRAVDRNLNVYQLVFYINIISLCYEVLKECVVFLLLDLCHLCYDIVLTSIHWVCVPCRMYSPRWPISISLYSALCNAVIGKIEM